ncbi:MAG: cobyric acid synthase [Pseudomonadota bacterium]
MMAKTLMLQGTGSDVGKSILTAAMCRIAVRRGLHVAPFKPQNMSNNAAACPGGGEIGRAQALQARAAGIAPHVDMNPVLLKPQTDRSSQVIVQGQVVTGMEAQQYMSQRGSLLRPVMESFHRLAREHDFVFVEGAGSPAEVNLRNGDIANMGFARKANVPVCLIGDIDKGGVIASLVGTKVVISERDAAMIKAFIINKFRGDPRLFDDGVSFIEDRTDWPCLGVIPWLSAAKQLPAEDAVSMQQPSEATGKALKIVAPMFSRIANFDDADPLRLEPGVDFQWVPPGQALPRDADVVVLFGTKSTLGDLAFMRDQKWDQDVHAHARAGGRVLGICGGYQMLGKSIFDPHGHDGMPGTAEGLGLLDIETAMTGEKRVATIDAISPLIDDPVSGYEIHIGESFGPDTQRPIFTVNGKPDGASSANGLIEGTYLHGVFSHDGFRQAWLRSVRGSFESVLNYEDSVETALDELADGVERAIDIDHLFALAKRPAPAG